MKKYFWFLIIALILHSCARVGSPVGGDKDTIAPIFMGSNIDTARVNVPLDIKELRLEFNEYVKLKDIQKNLIISPPIKKIKKIIPSNLATKYVLIQFEDTLKKNTTYQFNFGNSIQDNNESNPLRYFNFAFSTGAKIDENYISGEVNDDYEMDRKTASKNKNVVGLYQYSDSIDYRQKPYYISRVEDDGYFELEYITPGKYQLIGFSDDNENSIYDPGKEKIGFIKEPLEVNQSISGKKMTLSPSQKKTKFLEAKSVEGGLLIVFEGNPKDVKINSVDNSMGEFKATHRGFSDSLMVWTKPLATEQKNSKRIKLFYQTPEKNDTISAYYEEAKNVKMTLKSDNQEKLAPRKDFAFISNFVIDKINLEKWTLKRDSTKVLKFQAKISENNPYKVLVNADFEEGQNYQLTVPKESVSSYYYQTDKTYRFDFQIDKLENYGSATFKLTNPPTSKFWIQLLDYNNTVKYQQYTDASEIKFKLLPEGEFYVRILSDDNGNGFWDAANLEKQEYAEKSFMFYKILSIRPLWEIVEEWDLNTDKKLERTIKRPVNTATPDKNKEAIEGDEFDKLIQQSGNKVGAGFQRDFNN